MKATKIEKKYNEISLKIQEVEFSKTSLELVRNFSDFTDENGKPIFTKKWLFKRIMGIDLKKYKKQ